MKNVFMILLIMSTMLLTACNDVLDRNDPVSVARAFWTAALGGNPASAKPFMVDGDKIKIGIIGQSESDTALLGAVEQQGGYYFIDTTLQLSRDGKVASIPLKTIIVPVDGKWRVDYWSSKQSVFDATFDTSMKWFASTLDNANLYLEDVLGAEDQSEAMKHAEQRLNEEFGRVKEAILKNYKYRIEQQSNKQKKTES